MSQPCGTKTCRVNFSNSIEKTFSSDVTYSSSSWWLSWRHKFNAQAEQSYLLENFEFRLDRPLTDKVHFLLYRKTSWSSASFWDLDDENLISRSLAITVLVWMGKTENLNEGWSIINQSSPAVRLLIGSKFPVQFATVSTDTDVIILFRTTRPKGVFYWIPVKCS